MFVVGKCKKCGNKGALDIGDYSVEEAKELFSKMQFGECAFGGYHVELGMMDEYIEVDWEHLYDSKEEALESELWEVK